MSETTRRSKPVHDGRVLLMAEDGLKSAEHLTPSAAAAKVDDFYQAVGAAQYFETLCKHFYGLVADDDVLRPLFPERDWDRQAHTLTKHFVRLWGENDLTEAWRPSLHRAHSHWIITRTQRLRWLELMGRAARAVGTPQQQYDEFMTIMKIATGEMTAVSRGAAIARGDAFHWDGTPVDANPADAAGDRR